MYVNSFMRKICFCKISRLEELLFAQRYLRFSHRVRKLEGGILMLCMEFIMNEIPSPTRDRILRYRYLQLCYYCTKLLWTKYVPINYPFLKYVGTRTLVVRFSVVLLDTKTVISEVENTQ